MLTVRCTLVGPVCRPCVLAMGVLPVRWQEGNRQWRSGTCADTTNAYTCSKCTVCGEGLYAATACTPLTDTVCKPCDSFECGLGEYRDGECGGAQNGYECKYVPYEHDQQPARLRV